MSKELTLEGQVKNLQVSISIYRKEVKDILESLPALTGQARLTKLARLTVCDKMIETKSIQLEPLKAKLAETRPARQSKIQVSQDEIANAMAKYNIQ